MLSFTRWIWFILFFINSMTWQSSVPSGSPRARPRPATANSGAQDKLPMKYSGYSPAMPRWILEMPLMGTVHTERPVTWVMNCCSGHEPLTPWPVPPALRVDSDPWPGQRLMTPVRPATLVTSRCPDSESTLLNHRYRGPVVLHTAFMLPVS